MDWNLLTSVSYATPFGSYIYYHAKWHNVGGSPIGRNVLLKLYFRELSLQLWSFDLVFFSMKCYFRWGDTCLPFIENSTYFELGLDQTPPHSGTYLLQIPTLLSILTCAQTGTLKQLVIKSFPTVLMTVSSLRLEAHQSS